jgi:DNA modification methylase
MTADFSLSARLSVQDTKSTPKRAVLTDIVLPERYRPPISSRPRKKNYDRYFLGDNLDVLQQLIDEGYAKKFSLIYIDPPYFSQKKYSQRVFSDGKIINQKAYSDTWRSIHEYLAMLSPRLLLMKKLLKDNGSLFIHLDWRMSHYVKILLDEIFGFENFRNEIVWCYYGPGSPKARQFNREHQSIFWYSKSKKKWKFYPDAVRMPYSKTTLQKTRSKKNGFAGKPHNFEKGKIPEDWWSDIPLTQRFRYETVGFETQKPVKLLERIIKSTTKEGDIVGDFFAGSGTTAVAASSLGRRFITCDASFLSLKITKARLSACCKRPFLIEKFPSSRETSSTHKPAIRKRRIDDNHVSVRITRYPLCQKRSQNVFFESFGIDPSYDGSVFRGSWRHVQTDVDAFSFSIPKKTLTNTSQRVAIKLVDIFGNEHLQQIRIR